MEAAELVASVREHRDRLLLATDFDGTLAPIVTDPQASRLAEGAAAALIRLADQDVRIGVITGRDALTAVRLGGFDAIPGVVVAGLYGAERWQAGTLETPDTPQLIEALRAELPELLEDVHAADGVWIEDKRLSLVVHVRRAAEPAAELERLLPPATRLADRLGLELHPGRGVLEFRLSGYDKGRALRRLVAEIEPRAVLFAGDDRGDVPAFEALRELPVPAWGVLAESSETSDLHGLADLVVDGPAGVVDLLRAIAAS